jgi:hypothetical protein
MLRNAVNKVADGMERALIENAEIMRRNYDNANKTSVDMERHAT